MRCTSSEIYILVANEWKRTNAKELKQERKGSHIQMEKVELPVGGNGDGSLPNLILLASIWLVSCRIQYRTEWYRVTYKWAYELRFERRLFAEGRLQNTSSHEYYSDMDRDRNKLIYLAIKYYLLDWAWIYPQICHLKTKWQIRTTLSIRTLTKIRRVINTEQKVSEYFHYKTHIHT